uniref:Uncharacterized protein n=1 Tax=Neogobius melanostomus TaxID=47308 RepID=A0A8C6TIT1_9GOBI
MSASDTPKSRLETSNFPPVSTPAPPPPAAPLNPPKLLSNISCCHLSGISIPTVLLPSAPPKALQNRSAGTRWSHLICVVSSGALDLSPRPQFVPKPKNRPRW